MVKFATDFVSNINPLKLTKAIKESVGIVENIKTMKDGRLLLFCKDSRQQKATLGIKSMFGHKIECSIPEERNWIRGVISGIPWDVFR